MGNVVKLAKHIPKLLKGGKNALSVFKKTKQQGMKKGMKNVGKKLSAAAKKAKDAISNGLKNAPGKAIQNVKNAPKNAGNYAKRSVVNEINEWKADAKFFKSVGQSAARSTAKGLSAARNRFQAASKTKISGKNFEVSGPSSKSIANLGKQSSNVEQNVQHLMVDGGAQYVPKGTSGASTEVKTPKPEAEPLFGHAPKSNVVDFEAEKLKRLPDSHVETHLPREKLSYRGEVARGNFVSLEAERLKRQAQSSQPFIKQAAGAEGTHFPQGHGIRMSAGSTGSGHTTVGHGGLTVGGGSSSHLTSTSLSYGGSTPKVKSQKTPERLEMKQKAKKIAQDLSDRRAEELAIEATQLAEGATPKTNKIVLGKYESGGPDCYTTVAEEYRTKFYQLDDWDELKEKYGEEGIWQVNKYFIKKHVQNNWNGNPFLDKFYKVYFLNSIAFDNEPPRA